MPELDILSLFVNGGLGAIAVLLAWLGHVERQDNRKERYEYLQERKEAQKLTEKQIKLTDVKIARVEQDIKEIKDIIIQKESH